MSNNLYAAGVDLKAAESDSGKNPNFEGNAVATSGGFLLIYGKGTKNGGKRSDQMTPEAGDIPKDPCSKTNSIITLHQMNLLTYYLLTKKKITMKNYRRILLISFVMLSGKIYADVPIVVEHQFDNVKVYISSFSYQEEINKGLLIGKYIRNLSAKLEYEDSIQIFLDMKSSPTSYRFYNQDFISLHSQSLSFDLVSNLSIIEYAILQKKNSKQYRDSKISEILNKKVSNTVKNIIGVKMERPDLIKELESRSLFSYYYQDDLFHIYRKDDLVNILTVESLYYFSSIFLTKPLIFIDTINFYYVDKNGKLKKNHFSKNAELHERIKIFEVNSDLIVFSLRNTENYAEGIAVLNISSNKLIDRFDWDLCPQK